MLIAKIPRLFSVMFRNLTWHFRDGRRVVYLTFDDGPTPKVTDWVLERLDEYGAKATFFVLGRNAEAHPEIMARIRERGHALGNHTYSHMKGYSSSQQKYREDIEIADRLIGSPLFRPPYGRILPRQVRMLRKRYKIIMWSVLSVDYNRKISGDRVVKNVTGNLFPGSIVVFHDSDKARKNLYHALPEVLEFLKREGYTMEAISS